eukprot:scaffold108831_cov35-Tisochrysis_lutea.AAC.3
MMLCKLLQKTKVAKSRKQLKTDRKPPTTPLDNDGLQKSTEGDSKRPARRGRRSTGSVDVWASLSGTESMHTHPSGVTHVTRES